MKRKRLLFAVALVTGLLGWNNIQAQTDVTDQYLTNAGFETDEAAASLTNNQQTNPTGWTLTSSSGTANTQWGTANSSTTIQGYATSFSPSAGSNYFYLRCNWQSGQTLSLTQTTSEIPAGNYVISFDAVTYSSNGTQPTYTFTVNDGTTDLVNGSIVKSNTSWVNNSYVFTLNSASTLTITASMKPGAAASGKHDWMLIDNVKLIKLDNEVTSTYINNAGFETDEAAASLTGQTVQNTPSNWTITSSSSTDNTQWGTANSSTTIQGYATSFSPSAGSNYFYLRCNWQNGTTLSLTNTTSSLREGNYTLIFDAFTYSSNATQPTYTTTVGGESVYMAKNSQEWKTYSVNFIVSSAGATEITSAMTPGAATSGKHDWMLLDNYRLYYSEDLTTPYNNALAAANAAYNDDMYENVAGKEKRDLETAIDTDPTGQYATVISALTTATAAFIAAKPNYDALVAEIKKATALGASTTAAQAVLDDPTTIAATALTATQDLKVKEYNYVTNTYKFGVALSDTWNSSGNNTSAATFKNEHWSGEQREYKNQNDSNGQGWNAQSWDIDFNQDVTLPAGNYVFKVAGRKASGDNTEMALVVMKGEEKLGTVNDFPGGNAALGINKAGATSFDAEDSKGFANDGNGYGWEWRYVKFTLTADATVNIGIHAEGHDYHQWVSFGDYTLQTDKEENISLIAYNIALEAAQTTLADETYDAVVGEENTALANAIAADDDLDKTDKDAIEAATQTLTAATKAFTEALSSYKDIATAIDDAGLFVPSDGLPYAAPAKYAAIQTAIDNAENPSSAADAISKANAIRSAYRKYIESNALAEGVNDATSIDILDPNMEVTYDAQAHTFGAWQVFGQTDGNIQLLSGESFTDGEGNSNYKYADIWKSDNNAGIQQNVTLNPGRYLLTVTARAADTSGAVFKLFAGDNTADISRIGNKGGQFSGGWNDTSLEFEVTNTSDINIGVQSGNGKDLWWSATRFRLVRIGDALVSVKIASSGKSSYCNAAALDFSNVDGLKAYTVLSVSASGAVLSEVTGAVAGGTGLVLMGTGGETYNIPVVAEGATPSTNMLTGTTQATEVTAGEGETLLALSGGKFVKMNNGTVPANKAYLRIDSSILSSSVKSLGLIFDGADAINSVEAENVKGGIYNLAGQRMSSLQKGINIVNGVKVIVK